MLTSPYSSHHAHLTMLISLHSSHHAHLNSLISPRSSHLTHLTMLTSPCLSHHAHLTMLISPCSSHHTHLTMLISPCSAHLAHLTLHTIFIPWNLVRLLPALTPLCGCVRAFAPGMCAHACRCVCVRARLPAPLCVRLPPVWLCALACSLYVRVCPLCGCVRALATCMCAFACSYVCACACPCVCAFACSCLCARACPCVCAIAFPCVCARGLVPVCVCVCGGACLLLCMCVCLPPLCVALVPNILFFESGLNTLHLITLKNHNVCFHIFMSSLQVIFMIQYINVSYVCCMFHRYSFFILGYMKNVHKNIHEFLKVTGHHQTVEHYKN